MLPWSRKRLERYLKAEEHEFDDAIEPYRKERDEKERLLDLALFDEKREGSNWLENREMRMLEIATSYSRACIDAQIDIRKRLGQEYPELLTDAQLSKLEDRIVCSVHVQRQARRGDYQRRANAAGVAMNRPEQRDVAPYGNLEALARRKVRQLSLGRSLGRIQKPSLFSKWQESTPAVKVITAVIGLAATVIGLAGATLTALTAYWKLK